MPRTLIKTPVTKTLKRREMQLKALANARRRRPLLWALWTVAALLVLALFI